MVPQHFTTVIRSQTPLLCRLCGTIDQPAIAPGNGPHAFRAQCRHCGAFIQWLSRYSPEELRARREAARAAAMARRPPSQAQLNYLQTLGDTGPPPQTMSQASQRIDNLLQRYTT